MTTPVRESVDDRQVTGERRDDVAVLTLSRPDRVTASPPAEQLLGGAHRADRSTGRRGHPHRPPTEGGR